jgi:hypothetical protein
LGDCDDKVASSRKRRGRRRLLLLRLWDDLRRGRRLLLWRRSREVLRTTTWKQSLTSSPGRSTREPASPDSRVDVHSPDLETSVCDRWNVGCVQVTDLETPLVIDGFLGLFRMARGQKNPLHDTHSGSLRGSFLDTPRLVVGVVGWEKLQWLRKWRISHGV